jgi:hypothetical protein
MTSGNDEIVTDPPACLEYACKLGRIYNGWDVGGLRPLKRNGEPTTMEEHKLDIVIRTFNICGGNARKTCRVLNIHQSTFYAIIRRAGLSHRDRINGAVALLLAAAIGLLAAGCSTPRPKVPPLPTAPKPTRIRAYQPPKAAAPSTLTVSWENAPGATISIVESSTNLVHWLMATNTTESAYIVGNTGMVMFFRVAHPDVVPEHWWDGWLNRYRQTP